jgi:pyrroloquinoline quinone biosynthesis protein D
MPGGPHLEEVEGPQRVTEGKVKEESVFGRRPGIAWREEEEAAREVLDALAEGRDAGDDGTLILVDSGRVFELNLLGAEIWKLCDGRRTAGDVVDDILGRYEVERDELCRDVQAFLDDMTDRGWMVKL